MTRTIYRVRIPADFHFDIEADRVMTEEEVFARAEAILGGPDGRMDLDRHHPGGMLYVHPSRRRECSIEDEWTEDDDEEVNTTTCRRCSRDFPDREMTRATDDEGGEYCSQCVALLRVEEEEDA